MDDVVITINSDRHWLWRAADRGGEVRDSRGQYRQNALTTARLLRKRMHDWCVPGMVLVDKQKISDCALHENCPGATHRSHKDLNDQAECLHDTGAGEIRLSSFRASGYAQMFLSAHDRVATRFRLEHDRFSSGTRLLRHGPRFSTGLTRSPTSPIDRPDVATVLHENATCSEGRQSDRAAAHAGPSSDMFSLQLAT